MGKVAISSLMTGNEAVLKAALASGATMFCGYPITPVTEILSGWAKEAEKDQNLVFFQAEDETTAGFAMIGGIAVGRKAWTATAGIGNVLMQDPLSMAEAMRFPAVTYVGQRGGPSTGTVIYSQQELNLTRMGGNGEGLRIVYAPSSLQELYDLTIKAFASAWKYRFPTFILSDGYLGKTFGRVNIREPKKTDIVPAEAVLLNPEKQPQNIRNCYSQEKELLDVLASHFADYEKIYSEVAEAEFVEPRKTDILVCAWGAIGNSAKTALEILRQDGIEVGLFRPITMRPFPDMALVKATEKVRKILIVESANGQFGRIVRETLYGQTEAVIDRLYRPAMGIMPEEIARKVREML